MAYKEVGWKNYPLKLTKISAENLGHMDSQIKENADNIGDITKIEDIGDGTCAGAISDLNTNLENNMKSYTVLDYVISSSVTESIDTLKNNAKFSNYKQIAIGLCYGENSFIALMTIPISLFTSTVGTIFTVYKFDETQHFGQWSYIDDTTVKVSSSLPENFRTVLLGIK